MRAEAEQALDGRLGPRGHRRGGRGGGGGSGHAGGEVGGGDRLQGAGRGDGLGQREHVIGDGGGHRGCPLLGVSQGEVTVNLAQGSKLLFY